MLVGVVGKANTGKSTFFKATTLAEVEIANYPFVTIKPNHGIGFVRIECVEKEFNVQCKPKLGYCKDNKRFVAVELIDVAGLVPGAHEGKGMGNQFLDDLRQAHALIHIVDVSGSTNEKGEQVEVGTYDPKNDILFLEEELDMWYLGILKKTWDKFARRVNQEHAEAGKAISDQFSGLGVDEQIVNEILSKLQLAGKPLVSWNEDELKDFAVELRKKTKPMIIACNKVDTKAGQENYERLKSEFSERILVPCSAECELALMEASKHEIISYTPGEDNFAILKPDSINEMQKKALEFIKNNILNKFNSTGVQDVLNHAVFNLLKYISVFPVATSKLTDKDNNVLPDCFLVPHGITAQEFAYKVHTDIGKNFIRAVDLKTKQIIGKDHVLKDRDVVEIITSR